MNGGGVQGAWGTWGCLTEVETGGAGLQELEAVMESDMPCHARAANSGWSEG
jgi:hypothetical protein